MNGLENSWREIGEWKIRLRLGAARRKWRGEENRRREESETEGRLRRKTRTGTGNRNEKLVPGNFIGAKEHEKKREEKKKRRRGKHRMRKLRSSPNSRASYTRDDHDGFRELLHKHIYVYLCIFFLYAHPRRDSPDDDSFPVVYIIRTCHY